MNGNVNMRHLSSVVPQGETKDGCSLRSFVCRSNFFVDDTGVYSFYDFLLAFYYCSILGSIGFPVRYDTLFIVATNVRVPPFSV